MTKIDAVLVALRKCERKLQQLRAGRKPTADAEDAFAELADAVETILIDRRELQDRRRAQRETPDRRKDSRGAA